MKKLVSTLILAVLSVIVCCFCLFYVVAVSDKAKDSVEKIQSHVLNKEYEDAQKETKNLNEFWKNNHTMLSTIVHHSILEETEESIELLETSLENIEEEDEIDFWFESTRSLSRIKNLRDVEIPSIANIL